MLSPPTSMRSKASRMTRVSLVNRPACRPKSLASTASIASSHVGVAVQPDHGREDLLVAHLHRGRDGLEQRGRPQVAPAGAAGEQARAAFDGLGHPRLDPLGGIGIDDRTHVGGVVEWIAHPQRLDLRHQRLAEGVVDVLVHVDALHRDARLARVLEAAPDHALGRECQVGVLVDDDPGVAAELERDALAAGPSLERPADRRAAGEGQQADALVLDERRGVGRAAGDHAEGALREAGLLHDGGQLQRAQAASGWQGAARWRRRRPTPARPCGRPGSAGS